MHGILVVDKASGMTSHDVVARVRRRLGTRAVGHAGTLDPMATGVLVVAVGEGTKLVPYLASEEKSYDAEVTFGRATDTLDAEGSTTDEAPLPADLAARLDAALAFERGRIEQVPPAVSAIHVDGERAHVRARRGEAVALDPRPIRVVSLSLSAFDAPVAKVTLQVSKGYYVRSLARDLGERVGTPAHLSSLRRTASGSFTLVDAIPLDAADLDQRVLSLVGGASRAMPTLRLNERGERDARSGRPVRAEDMTPPSAGLSAWLDASGAVLVAVGEVSASGVGQVKRGFAL
jgi:tRNA pseudouridine55 synthase